MLSTLQLQCSQLDPEINVTKLVELVIQPAMFTFSRPAAPSLERLVSIDAQLMEVALKLTVFRPSAAEVLC